MNEYKSVWEGAILVTDLSQRRHILQLGMGDRDPILKVQIVTGTPQGETFPSDKKMYLVGSSKARTVQWITLLRTLREQGSITQADCHSPSKYKVLC